MGLFTSSWERQVDNNLFDFIEVDCFRNYKCTTLLSYMTILSMLFLHIALYAVDVYTCVRLLAFNEWSSQVKPYLSFKISKWLFSACILCSIVLLVYDAIRGIRVFLTRNISLIYTNNFAKVARSLRYKYHCVLNEINPPSGFDKMAFYTYFTLSGSMKLILADSPRQVINALTLYSVFDLESGTSGFWTTLKTISTTNRNEAIILYSMFASFVIWIFFMCELFFALVFMFPVIHNIRKQRFRSMKQYVCVKVDHTVKKLAKKFAKKRLMKEHRKRSKENLCLDEKPSIPAIPTVPSFSTLGSTEKYSLPRATTVDSLASYNTLDSSNSNPTNPFIKSSQFSSRDRRNSNPFRELPTRKAPSSLINSNSNTSLSSYIEPQKPRDLHHRNPSQLSLLTRYNDSAPAVSVYGTTSHADSVNSLQRSVVECPYLIGSTTSLGSVPHTTYSDSIMPSDVGIRQLHYPKREVFMDEEKYIGSIHESPVHSDYDDFDDDVDDEGDVFAEQLEERDIDHDSLLDDDTPLSRADVRPSLIIRARDMESEDYSKLRR